MPPQRLSSSTHNLMSKPTPPRCHLEQGIRRIPRRKISLPVYVREPNRNILCQEIILIVNLASLCDATPSQEKINDFQQRGRNHVNQIPFALFSLLELFEFLIGQGLGIHFLDRHCICIAVQFRVPPASSFSIYIQSSVRAFRSIYAVPERMAVMSIIFSEQIFLEHRKNTSLHQ